MEKQIELRVGLVNILSHSIEDQLKEQKLKIDNPEKYQKAFECIGFLRISGFLADHEAERSQKRVFDKISKSVLPL